MPDDFDVREDLRTLYRQHWQQIRTHAHVNHPIRDVYNVRLESTSQEAITEVLHQMVEPRQQWFKVNIAFAFILRNNVTGEQRYYHASQNTRMFDTAVLISSLSDLDKLLVDHDDLLHYARKQRPDSK